MQTKEHCLHCKDGPNGVATYNQTHEKETEAQVNNNRKKKEEIQLAIIESQSSEMHLSAPKCLKEDR